VVSFVAGKVLMKKNIAEYRVIFSDINYLSWFERGRTEFFREIDLPYTEIVKQGIMIPVAEVYCKYHKPARYDDVVQIETTVSSFKRVSIVFACEIYRKSDRTLLISGHTKHAFLDLNGKIIKIPDFIHEKIKSYRIEISH